MKYSLPPRFNKMAKVYLVNKSSAMIDATVPGVLHLHVPPNGKAEVIVPSPYSAKDIAVSIAKRHNNARYDVSKPEILLVEETR